MRHYAHDINVIIDGNLSEIVTVGSAGDFNPNTVKNIAIEKVKANYPNSILTAIIVNNREITLDEYRIIFSQNPPWYRNIEK